MHHNSYAICTSTNFLPTHAHYHLTWESVVINTVYPAVKKMILMYHWTTECKLGFVNNKTHSILCTHSVILCLSQTVKCLITFYITFRFIVWNGTFFHRWVCDFLFAYVLLYIHLLSSRSISEKKIHTRMSGREKRTLQYHWFIHSVTVLLKYLCTNKYTVLLCLSDKR